MEYTVKHLDKTYDISVEKKDEIFFVSASGKEYLCDARLLNEEVSILSDNKVIHSVVVKNDDKYYVFLDGETYEFENVPERSKNFRKMALEQTKSQVVVAPMPGKVIKTCVEEGEKVSIDQILLIMESMKMETSVRATINGKVKKLHISAGDSIDAGQKIVEIEAKA